MWRLLRFGPCFQRAAFTTAIKANKLPPCKLKLTLKVGTAAFLMPNLIYLDVQKMHNDQPPVKSNLNEEAIPAIKKEDVGWHLSLRDVMHVTKLLLVGGLVWGISGALLGGVLFKMCSLFGHHVTRWISIPTSILSGVGVAAVGLHRGLGHSLLYFIHKGLAGHVLKRVVPTRLGDATVVHYNAAVSRVTYSFRQKAKQSGFIVSMALTSLSKKLESYLLLLKDEDKLLKHGNLTEEVINHKLKKAIRHEMRKPVYIVGLVYGVAVSAVAILVWRS